LFEIIDMQTVKKSAGSDMSVKKTHKNVGFIIVPIMSLKMYCVLKKIEPRTSLLIALNSC